MHLAAKVSLAGDPAEFRPVNVEGTRALLDAAERAGVSRFVQVSSPSVAHAGSALAGVGAEPADPAACARRVRADEGRGRAARAGTRLRRASASSRSARTSCGVRVTRSSSPASSSAPGAGDCRCSTVARALIDSTYVDNAATGIVAALDRAAEAHGRAFVLTNGEPRPVGELLAGICLAAGVQPPRWSMPASARACRGIRDRARLGDRARATTSPR